MRRAWVGIVVLGVVVATRANAEQPKCPDTSKVKSGTDFCASENVSANFPSVAFCESPDDRYRKVCPKEWVESMWALSKQGNIDPWQNEIDNVQLVLDARRDPTPEREEAVNNNPAARARSRDTDAALHRTICFRSRDIVVWIEPRLRGWKSASGGKWAVETIKEADGRLKAANALEATHCKFKEPADAGADH